MTLIKLLKELLIRNKCCLSNIITFCKALQSGEVIQSLSQFKRSSASSSEYIPVSLQWKVLSTLESRPCYSSSDFFECWGTAASSAVGEGG